MKILHGLFALMTATVSLPAAEDLPLVQPPKTGLMLTKLEAESAYAEFGGRTWVTGVLVAQWVVGVDEEEANTFDVRLIPDERAVKALPYFKGFFVHDIIPVNPKAALRMAFDKQVIGRLERKEILVARARGGFLLTQYVVGVECDDSWSRAMIVRTRIPKPPLLAGQPHPTGC